MSNFRDAIKLSVQRHAKKQLRTPRTKANGKPEKAVEKACMDWLRNNGFSVNVVESKAVYNAQAGRYLKGQTDQGFSDAVGCHNSGLAVFIEFKAPGRLSTLRPSQKAFLRDKIDFGAFACVVDGPERLEQIWKEFEKERQSGVNNAASKTYLLSLIK